MRTRFGLGLLGSMITAGLVLAQAPSGRPTQAPSGRATYDARCARCHGGDGTGGEVSVNLITPIDSRTDADLTSFLRAGRPQSGMPAFADLSETDINSLVSYLRSFVPVSFRNRADPERRQIRMANNQTLSGFVLSEGMSDLQLRTDDKKIHLLRKAAANRYREVTSQRDWPTYHGDPSGNRYSTLTQINKNNASKLTPKWIYPVPNAALFENTPIVVEGIMYVSTANEINALDAGTGRRIWNYARPRTKGLVGNASGGINRGVAISGERVFLLTDNVHLLSLNRFNGELLWETEMADWRQNYNGTSAPLVVGDLIITGTAGGDEGVRGFVAAYQISTGKEVWRFWTVPAKGEKGSETWKGTSLEHGAGATWMTGTYDAQLDLVYWPVGNPGPDLNGDDRDGDNLYTDSIVALEAKTGKMKWYYQFTPHDVHDWDAQEPPVLVDAAWPNANSSPRKLLLQANRNGFFYVLDRTSGELLLAKPFIKKLNWAKEIGKDGRPVLNPLPENANGESMVCPGLSGGTNWFSTSFNPITGYYYFQVMERCNIFVKRTMEWQAGKGFMGGSARPVDEPYTKSLRALNIRTGETAWDLPHISAGVQTSGGVLSSASGVVFFGENSGSFMAADAATGQVLFDFPTNQVWRASPMTYMFDNKQYVAIAVGQTVMAFALGE